MEGFEEEKTLTLRKPVKIGEIVYDSLALREPTAGELSKANKQADPIDSMILLISLVAKVPKTAIEQMTQRDLEDAADFLGGFGSDSRKDISTSSPS